MAPTHTATTQSLYTRLGGYDVIAAFVDNWLALVVPDPQLGGYFKGMSLDTKRKARQLIVDFIAERVGGPVIYTGRPMKVLHEGLGISRDDYAVLMRHAEATLDALEVARDARDGLLAFLASLEGDTVERG
jgi:hemoglobin